MIRSCRFCNISLRRLADAQWLFSSLPVLGLALVLLLTGLPVAAQSAPALPAGLDTELQKAMQEEQLPSLSVAILRDGKIVYAKAFGYAELEKKTPATVDSLYRLASISKTMTAVAVMQLNAQGKLALDAPAQKYCPAFTGHAEVTVRELLSHRSGVHHYKSHATEFNTVHYGSLSEAVKSFAGDALQFPAGHGYQYTSYGFTVLGCAVEGASGESYSRYVGEHILKPVGMKHTAVDVAARPARNEVHFYTLHDGKLEAALPLDTSDRLPGGGWISTPSEMVRFGEAVMNHKLLDLSKTQEMWTETTHEGDPMHYALGWVPGIVGGEKIVEHAGGQSGTSTSLVLVPGKKLAVAVFANRNNADVTKVSHRIVEEMQ